VATGGNGQFQGFSAFEKTGASTWLLTGTTTQLTPWKISGGTLSVSSDGALGDVNGVLTLLNNATLATTASISTLRNVVLGQGGGNIDVAPSTTLALAGVISGQGGLSKSGDGVMLLTGTNTYTGGTTIAGGTLQLGDGGSTGSVIGDVLNNGALVIDRNNTLNVDGLISGSGNVTQAGSGTTIFTADNRYTGTTTVSAGTLIINGNQSTASGLTTVNTGATLGGKGTLGGSVVLADGATLAPGDVGVVPGTLTIAQNLQLSNGSLLDYHFGQAGVPGGALNDLVKVHGDLTLDGTINVKTTPGGSFDPGIYRVFTYDGKLTDNGLQIGTIPSPNYYVQTSVQKQVNLINTNGLTLNFWDGANGGRNDGIIDGGDGLWQNSRGNINWTTWTGSVNAPFADAAFAVFTAAPGTVRVDNSLGQVTAGGMQFDANGYHLTGDDIQLVQTSADSPASVIRVGNGTPDGAADIATIDNTLFGDVQLRKTDLGTLILNADNTYTGGTLVDGGTLVVGDINHQGAGLGAGDVTVAESGTLSGSGVVAGHVTNNGTVAALNAISGQESTPNSNLTLADGLTNNGTVNLAGTQGQAGNTLTVKNRYVGNQGQLVLNTFMGDDRSASDRLVLDNAKATGDTALVIKHAGGNGAQTQTGILVVDARNGSTTDPNAFSLSDKSDGYRKNIGTIASGAYDYSLVRGGNGGNAESWYLSSLLMNRSDSPAEGQPASARPSLRPEIGSYIGNIRAANTLFAMTLYDRLGNAQNFLPSPGEEGSSFWIRNVGGHNNADAGAGAISTQANRYVLQMGGDIVSGSTDGKNRFLAGVMGGYASERSNSVSQGSGLTSKGSVNGYSVGLYGTWYANGAENQGAYVDSWMLYNWFDNSVEGEGLSAERYQSKGMTASLETGYTHKTGEYETFAGSANDVFIQPKAQVIWMGVSADNHVEQNGTQVNSTGDNNLQTRLGFRTFLKGKSRLDAATPRQFEPFAEVSWIHNTRAYGTTMDGVNTQLDGTRNIGEIKVGVEGKINQQLSFWGNVAEQVGGKGYNDTQGTLGMRYSF
jgi:autotransporter family porin